MAAYYNEFDPKAAAWLRQLIKNGDIADGEVDERSIIEVSANDLRGFTQHHFFAGIGVWSYALRNAGWTDDRPVCTASLPCQPFSIAGKRLGADDERHLLPHFLNLVRQYGFNTIFGEQVERAIKQGWIDDLQTNMEREGYAIGHCVLGAHSVNAAHVRKRCYWVAHAISKGSQGWLPRRQDEERKVIHGHAGRGGTDSSPELKRANSDSRIELWRCKDGKQRPIKSGIKPLVDGATKELGHSCDPDNTAIGRVMRTKGYGNAIHAGVATSFIQAVRETLDEFTR